VEREEGDSAVATERKWEIAGEVVLSPAEMIRRGDSANKKVVTILGRGGIV